MEPKEGYIIPFEGDVQIGQGYNSKFSHQKFENFDATYSLDFPLPEGTQILAAKKGTVSRVKDDSDLTYSGTEYNEEAKKAAEEANFVELEHEDGTFTAYYHLKKGSAKVKPGDTVKQGQPIAESGNVGWSTAPHLDFTAFYKDRDGFAIKTFPTKFSNYEGTLEDKTINPHNYS